MEEQYGVGEDLRRLHDHYAWEVNAALEEGRDDLVEPLVEAYTDEALLVILRHEAGADRA